MSKEKTISIVFYGIGGQGVLKASEICGLAAHLAGYHVKKSEVHGMSQRNGSVESHIRFGKDVFSPMVPAGLADFLVCMHKDEYYVFKDYLKKGGMDLIKYLEYSQEKIQNKRYLNTFLLGVLSYYLPIKEDFWYQSMKELLKEKDLDENKKIFKEGRKSGGTL